VSFICPGLISIVVSNKHKHSFAGGRSTFARRNKQRVLKNPLAAQPTGDMVTAAAQGWWTRRPLLTSHQAEACKRADLDDVDHLSYSITAGPLGEW
jgi:hypothetical protein